MEYRYLKAWYMEYLATCGRPFSYGFQLFGEDFI